MSPFHMIYLRSIFQMFPARFQLVGVRPYRKSRQDNVFEKSTFPISQTISGVLMARHRDSEVISYKSTPHINREASRLIFIRVSKRKDFIGRKIDFGASPRALKLKVMSVE